jgi:hypothetical protein
MDDKQRLFVDVTTPAGRQLFQGMLTGQTAYPDQYSANLTVGHNLILSQVAAQKKQGLEMLIQALEEYPAPAPFIEMYMSAARYPELRPRIDEVCMQYILDFEKNAETYARQDGYNQRIEALRVALIRLQHAAETRGDTKLAAEYGRQIDHYEAVRAEILSTKRW